MGLEKSDVLFLQMSSYALLYVFLQVYVLIKANIYLVLASHCSESFHG